MNNPFLFFQFFHRTGIQKSVFSTFATFVLAFVLAPQTTQIFAAAGAVDAAFSTGTTLFNGQSVEAIAVQTDGRILVGGDFEVVAGARRNRIARLNADGSLDASFDPAVGADDLVQAIAVQADGRILVGGSFVNFNGANRKYLVRLNADGSLDQTFNQDFLNDQVLAIVVQPDGKIVIGGYFNSANASHIARLNFDGSLDAEFATNLGAGADNTVTALALDADNKILLGGLFTSVSESGRGYIARLQTNGNLDASFDSETGADDAVGTIAVQSDGKIVIGGSFSTYGGAERNNLARVNADGSLDTSFDIGTGTNSEVNDVEIQADGKILVGGFFSFFNNVLRRNLIRLNADGSFDSSFTPPVVSDEVKAIKIQPAGEIIAGGDFANVGNSSRAAIARFDYFGALDQNFSPIIGIGGSVNAIQIQTDGKIIIGGAFFGVSSKLRNNLARLNADGTIDETFNSGAGANGRILAIALQNDGKILIGGQFTSFNGTSKNRLARLNADGSLDASFNASIVDNVKRIFFQPNGKIVVQGDIYSVNNDSSRRGLARLNADGTTDTSFAANNYNSLITAADVQPDGKIVIGGFFTAINTIPTERLARLNANGTIDSSFNGGSPNGIPDAIRILANGKILVTGSFTQINNAPRQRIALLNADGAPDENFNGGTGFNSNVRTIVEQPNGRILIGGAFTQYNGINRRGIVRIYADGALDTSFRPGAGANDVVSAIALAANERLLLGGDFSAYDNVPRLGLARILAGGANIWTGAANSDFQNPANWSENFVPTGAENAEIPANAPHQPILSGAANLTNLQIDSTATLTIDAGAILTLQGLTNDGVLGGAGNLNLAGASFVNNGTISTAIVDFDGSGVKSLNGAGAFAGNTVNINENIRLNLENNHTFYRVVIADGAAFDITSRTVRLRAPGIALSGSLFVDSSTLIYEGNAAQTINSQTLANLTINNSSGVSLNVPLEVRGTLNLANGILKTGANTLYLPSASSATRANGYVFGKVQKAFAAGQSFTFPVGNSSGYAPVTLANVDNAVGFTVQVNDGFLAGTEQTQSLQTNWTINAGSNARANLTFQYPQQSVPTGANEANFKFVRRVGSVNTELAPTTIDVNTNIFTLANVSQFSDWTLGRNLAPTAANVEIGGRVSSGKRGAANVRVRLTNMLGQTRSTQTNALGFYRFADVPAGATYIVSVAGKGYIFSEPTRVLFVVDDVSDVNFNAVQLYPGIKFPVAQTSDLTKSEKR